MELIILSELVKSWLYEAGEKILVALESPMAVNEKTSRKDIVTNVDKEIEAFIAGKIMTHFPEDSILGEEGTQKNQVSECSRTWLIDPIDGTLNFYKQHDYFCLMIAIEQKNQPSLGFIYEPKGDELLWGGSEIGVYLNNERLQPPTNQPLEEAIININSGMLLDNCYNLQEASRRAIGIRMIGCAGIGIKEVILGKQGAYVSYLQPWDYAAGQILAEALGLKVAHMDGKTLELDQRVPVIFATPMIYQEIQKIKEL